MNDATPQSGSDTPPTPRSGSSGRTALVVPDAELIAIIKLTCPICGGKWQMSFGGTPSAQTLSAARTAVRNSVQAHVTAMHPND